MNLTSLETIKKLLISHDLWAKKFLGQNFLINENALAKIIETAAIKKDDNIIEIGAGLGVLTRELAQKAKQVTSIELDQSLLPILEKTLGEFKNIELTFQDALRFIPPKTKYKVVANIPYNITSPLLNHFLQADSKPESMTLLVQKEVAEKICSKKRTILSLQVELFAKASLIQIVKNTGFYPAPKVDSAIIHIQLYKKTNQLYLEKDEALQILKLAKQAFLGKRKKLSNTLSQYKSVLQELNLQDHRPETLTVENWKKLNFSIKQSPNPFSL